MISKTTNFRNFHFSITSNFSNQNDRYADKNLLQTPTGYLKLWLFHYSKKSTLLHKCDICLQVFLLQTLQVFVLRNFWQHCSGRFRAFDYSCLIYKRFWIPFLYNFLACWTLQIFTFENAHVSLSICELSLKEHLKIWDI